MYGFKLLFRDDKQYVKIKVLAEIWPGRILLLSQKRMKYFRPWKGTFQDFYLVKLTAYFGDEQTI